VESDGLNVQDKLVRLTCLVTRVSFCNPSSDGIFLASLFFLLVSVIDSWDTEHVTYTRLENCTETETLLIPLFGFHVTSVAARHHCVHPELRQQPGLQRSTMTDDFLQLVSQANPAASQYHQANNRYPPTTSMPSGSSPYSDHLSQQMDPFFDDDDIPDSAFGPAHSQESGLPLAKSAALPSGVDFSDSSKAPPQSWNFDDDDDFQASKFQASNGQSFPGPSFSSSPTAKRPITSIPKLKSKKWKWPWQKEKVLTGERIVALNNSAANADYCSNVISTSKYNLATFLPKFLFGTLIFFSTAT
jgi:Phospholipid-translocating ATPase N-terminal